MGFAESGNFGGIPCNQRFGHELAVIQDEEFFRGVSHLCWVVHHQRLGVDVVEHVGGGDVAHVEGRVLAHVDNVKTSKIYGSLFAKGEMAAGFIPHGHIMAGCKQCAAAQSQGFGFVVEQGMLSNLSFQHDCKS